MLTSSFSARTVAVTSPRSLPTAPLALLLGIAIAALAGCAEESTAPKPQAAAAPAPAAPAGPPPVVPFEQAVLNAANAVFTQAKAQAGSAPNVKLPVVIDPLVDGMTGAQSTATQQIQSRIVALVAEKYPEFEVLKFNAANVAKGPLVLVGTFTGVNSEFRTAGAREAYRFCLVLGDLKTGKTVAKGVARAASQGVDITPTAFFRDSPAWSDDKQIGGYIATCQGTRPGDPIHPAYLQGVTTAALISEAIDAYAAGQYQSALDSYAAAARLPAGDQLRVYNGIYLANWKLGRRAPAAEAFDRVVDFGLRNNRLAVKFLFKPGSASFAADATAAQYAGWLTSIGKQSAAKQACLQVDGHASRSGTAAANEKLSLQRAEFVKGRLERTTPALRKNVVARGLGERETLIGNGRDDASDALDRRVEFKVVPSCTTT
jgi:outer membrane protein OmpA-like peptidoglycan-associated protein